MSFLPQQNIRIASTILGMSMDFVGMVCIL